MVVFLPQEFPWNVPPPLRCWQSLMLCVYQSQRATEDGSMWSAPAWSGRRDILIFLSARRRWKTLRSMRICNSRGIALQKRTSTSSRRRPGVAGAISRDTGLGIFLCYAPLRHSSRLVEHFSRHAPLVLWNRVVQLKEGSRKTRIVKPCLWSSWRLKCTAHYVHLTPPLTSVILFSYALYQYWRVLVFPLFPAVIFFFFWCSNSFRFF